MTAFSILLVEDDIFISRTLKNYMDDKGLITYQAFDSGSAINHILSYNPDAIVLDINLPTESGLVLIEKIKSISSAPVLFYTSHEKISIEIQAISNGGNDFINKSRGPDVLYSRLSNLLKTTKVERNIESRDSIKLSNLEINITTSTCLNTQKNIEIKLTSTELNALFYLAAKHPNIVTRDELSNATKGANYDGFSRGIDLLISRLRKKLFKADSHLNIDSIRGKGYKLKDSEESSDY
ncbi:response regulator transcription factor [Vibrio lamellibrachiae]|uniref:response regulator transcription factor n=1 Tax=Vibrio lamellibrachiae TaxID=2910253 RepID=UPI003D1142F7